LAPPPPSLCGEITLKNGCVEQTDFDSYQMLRMNGTPVIEVHIIKSAQPSGGMGETGRSATWQATAQDAGQHDRVEATGVRARLAPLQAKRKGVLSWHTFSPVAAVKL
jgi:isoquinoline 1-oxidoreductase beta subunit